MVSFGKKTLIRKVHVEKTGIVSLKYYDEILKIE